MPFYFKLNHLFKRKMLCRQLNTLMKSIHERCFTCERIWCFDQLNSEIYSIQLDRTASLETWPFFTAVK